MKFLSDSSQIQKELKRLIRAYSTYRWAVAWASNSECCDLLSKKREGIRQMIVGLHFYQTHPDFIKSFLDCNAVRYIKSTSGIFHSKLYLFEGKNGKWECIVGSPNFTGAALSGNEETAVLISSEDDGAKDAYRRISGAIERYWKDAERMKTDQLAGYRERWKRQKVRRDLLAETFESRKKRQRRAKPLFEVEIINKTWKEYVEQVKADEEHGALERLALLEKAHELFAVHPHFADMDLENRKGIAGTIHGSEDWDWLWFGSMKGAGVFKHAIIENRPAISLALDQIPLDGEVTRQHYEEYLLLFTKALSRPGIATATRLLAMKRPDYFVCLDSANRKKLSKDFGISQSIALDEYWKSVIERLMASDWWQTPKPDDPLERRIWNGRAAMLDAIYYVPKK